MKIKFIANSPHYYHDDPALSHRAKKGEWCVVSCSYFALRHWYTLRGLHNDRVQWQVPDIICTENAQLQLESLLRDPPDVLALSVFIWNEHTQHWLAREFKRHHPGCLVVMGGPQLTAHKRRDFFDRYPHVDWAVYGDGERPFQQIVDRACDPGSVPDAHMVNAVTLRDGRYHCYPYELLSDHEYLATSMWLDQEQEILRVLRDINARGIPTSHIKFTVEFARGCMYNCTFCDWSQNLTSKVKRRRHDWKQEMDLFHRLDIPLRESDANFGQWPEDLEIFEYANSLVTPGRNFHFIPKNTPKTKKHSILYIMRRCFEVHGTQHPFQAWALQDPDERVLEAIDRPSIPFDEICAMVRELNETAGPEVTDLHQAQLITPLPEQSLDSWSVSLQRIWNEAKIKDITANPWDLLPNSPGHDPAYRDRYQIRSIRAYVANAPHDPNVATLEELYSKCSTNNQVNQWYSTSDIVANTSTMSFVESMAARQMCQYIQDISTIRRTKDFMISDSDRKRLKDKSLRTATLLHEQIKTYMHRHGFVIMGERLPDGKIKNSSMPLRPWN